MSEFTFNVRLERHLLDISFELNQRRLIFEFKDYGKHFQLAYFPRPASPNVFGIEVRQNDAMPPNAALLRSGKEQMVIRFEGSASS
jgi:hypothetical protein